eukprot:scaffold351276_cov35-Prasinocladus_malaysianus.AAC.1
MQQDIFTKDTSEPCRTRDNNIKLVEMDVVRRYKETHDNWDSFGELVAFQLNDTHPTIGVAELMRLLMDENGLGWTKSWELTTKVFSFTNHTVLPEALEKWPVTLVEKLLPRHMQIIYDINWRFIQTLRNKYGDDYKRIGKMSIIEELADGQKFIRMAYMALVASHTVNGVAAIHSDIIKKEVKRQGPRTFKEFYDLWPEKFQNKTNGVTQRRWLAFCNPGLRKLISDKLGNEEWITDLEMLQDLVPHADDKEFQEKWWDVKQQNKVHLAGAPPLPPFGDLCQPAKCLMVKSVRETTRLQEVGPSGLQSVLNRHNVS